MRTLLFLLLSMFSGMLEYGFLWMGLTQGFGIAHTILYSCLPYQLGNLLFIKEGAYLNRGIMAVIAALICFGIFFAELFPLSYTVVLLFIAIGMLSVSIQTARSFMKASVNTGLKRTSRIVGFAMSLLFVMPMLRVIAISIIAALTIFVLLKQKMLMKG